MGSEMCIRDSVCAAEACRILVGQKVNFENFENTVRRDRLETIRYKYITLYVEQYVEHYCRTCRTRPLWRPWTMDGATNASASLHGAWVRDPCIEWCPIGAPYGRTQRYWGPSRPRKKRCSRAERARGGGGAVAAPTSRIRR